MLDNQSTFNQTNFRVPKKPRLRYNKHHMSLGWMIKDMATPAPVIETPDSSQSWGLWGALRRLSNAVLGRVWFLHPTIQLRVALSPSITLQTIATAAQPSTKRLHLRNVFASGRRYYVFSNGGDGFVLTTNAKVSWRYSQRTGLTAMLYGDCAYDGYTTTVSVRSRIKLTYLVNMLLLPTWMTALIIYMPWHPLVIVGCIIALYGLSWMGYRANAMLDAYEMLFFLEKAFEEHTPQAIPTLEAQGAQVLYNYRSDFTQAWDKFYEQIVQDDPAQTATTKD
jgi:hypothetical protein